MPPVMRRRSISAAPLLIALASTLLATPVAQAQTFQDQVSLDFGSLIVAGPGLVTISETSDTRSAAGGVILVGPPFGVRGAITIVGPVNSTVQITCPTSIPVVLPGGSATLTPIIENGTFQIIPASGQLIVHVGGGLAFTGAESSGAGSGDVFVTVDILP